MAKYNLVTYLLVLLSVVAAVLMTSFIDSYGQFDVADVLSLRVFNLGEAGQEQAKEEVPDVETEQMVPEGWVGYPVVSINYSGDSGFAPGIR